MALLGARPVEYKDGGKVPNDKENVLGTNNFALGLITDADPLTLPDNCLSIGTNLVYSRNQLLRRNGTVLYTITKPDSSRILLMFGYTTPVDGLALLRFAATKLYRVASGGGWTEITPSGIAAFSGGDFDPFFVTVGDDRCFAANGVDAIREIKPSTNTYVALGNAPIYKYITTGFNRIVGANLTGGDAFEIGWSGDLNYSEWDSLVDPSAGSTPLVDSPSDTNDDITGLFTIANNIIVMRLHSIWVGVAQPSTTAPFRFYPGLAKVGADCPKGQCLTDYGIAWYSYQDSATYVWNPELGNVPAEKLDISANVARAMKIDAYDPSYVSASYSSDAKTLSILMESPLTSTRIQWDYNFRTKTWLRNTILDVSGIFDVPVPSSVVTIDDLTGTIDSLVGTIDSLGGIVSRSTRFYGRTDGDLHYMTFYHGIVSQSGNIQLTDAGTSFDTTIAYKVLELPLGYMFVNLIRAVVTPWSVGTVTLSYSKDGGLNWTTAKAVTYVSGDLNQPQIIQFKKAIRARTIVFKLTTSDCMCTNNGIYVKAPAGGQPKSSE